MLLALDVTFTALKQTTRRMILNIEHGILGSGIKIEGRPGILPVRAQDLPYPGDDSPATAFGAVQPVQGLGIRV